MHEVLFEWDPALVFALIEGLPIESHYKGTYLDRTPAPEASPVPAEPARRSFVGWTTDHAILADIADRLDLLLKFVPSWQDNKGPPFTPWPRPSQQPAKRVGFVSVLRKMFGGIPNP